MFVLSCSTACRYSARHPKHTTLRNTCARTSRLNPRPFQPFHVSRRAASCWPFSTYSDDEVRRRTTHRALDIIERPALQQFSPRRLCASERHAASFFPCRPRARHFACFLPIAPCPTRSSTSGWGAQDLSCRRPTRGVGNGGSTATCPACGQEPLPRVRRAIVDATIGVAMVTPAGEQAARRLVGRQNPGSTSSIEKKTVDDVLRPRARMVSLSMVLFRCPRNAPYILEYPFGRSDRAGSRTRSLGIAPVVGACNAHVCRTCCLCAQGSSPSSPTTTFGGDKRHRQQLGLPHQPRASPNPSGLHGVSFIMSNLSISGRIFGRCPAIRFDLVCASPLFVYCSPLPLSLPIDFL